MKYYVQYSMAVHNHDGGCCGFDDDDYNYETTVTVFRYETIDEIVESIESLDFEDWSEYTKENNYLHKLYQAEKILDVCDVFTDKCINEDKKNIEIKKSTCLCDICTCEKCIIMKNSNVEPKIEPKKDYCWCNVCKQKYINKLNNWLKF